MANYNPKNGNNGFFSNGNNGFFSNDNNSSDEWYELSHEALEKIAGGVGGYYDYDTYRFWRDQNGVLREFR